MVRKTLSIALGVFAAALLSASVALAQAGYKSKSSEKSAPDTSGSRMSGSEKLAPPDMDFLRKAAAGEAAEVELGKLAVERASDPDVKKFGQKMVDDHSKVNDDLEKLARRKKVDVPSRLDTKDEKERDHLSKISGAEFDRAYMKVMVSDHRKDVAEFEKVAKSAVDPDVRRFASEKLPELKEHLDLAKTDNSRVAAHHRMKGKTEKTS